MTEYEAGCELCGCGIEGYLLCSGCARATLERLHRMPDLYRALAMLLPPASRQQGQGGGARPVEAPLPVSEPVLTLRGPGGIVGILEDWHSALAADRKFGRPVIRGGVEVRVSTAAHQLAANIEYIAAIWPQAGDFAREIRDLERDVLTMISPPEGRSLRMGNCPTTYDGVLCGAALRLPPGAAVATCKWCGSRFPAGTWAALRLAQDEMEAAS